MPVISARLLRLPRLNRISHEILVPRKSYQQTRSSVSRSPPAARRNDSREVDARARSLGQEI
jgi:hypothetical protein